MRARLAFALPTVILVMLILVGALASGFGMLSSERGADDAAIQAQAAAALAESGLQQGLRNRPGLGLSAVPGASDSVRLSLTGGYADIVTIRLRAASGTTIPALYLVRSRGVSTRTGVAGAGNAVAISTAFATFQSQTMTILGAVTSINGAQKTGGSGLISGADACNAADTLKAIVVPTDQGYTQRGTGDVLTGGLDNTTFPNVAAMAAAIPFDWAEVKAGTAFTPDTALANPGNRFMASAWFSATRWASTWPIILVTGNLDLQGNFRGKGMLVVTGSLTFGGGAIWDGPILVGDATNLTGTSTISGALVTGLNALTGAGDLSTSLTDDLNGTKTIQYSSCTIASALASLGALRVYQNSWANNFPSY